MKSSPRLLEFSANPVEMAINRWIDRQENLSLLVVLILFVNGVAWLDGSVQFGAFDLYRTSLPFYPVIVLAVMHYLNHVAHRALAAFRPALGESDVEYARFEYELTTLPRRHIWAIMGLSLLFTAAFILFMPDLENTFRQSPWLVVVDSVIYVIVQLLDLFLFWFFAYLKSPIVAKIGEELIPLIEGGPEFKHFRATVLE